MSKLMKFDTNKPRYDLIPAEALEEIAYVMTFGAKKYADHNWRQGTRWGRYFAALMRHLWDWWSGKKIDEETGRSPLSSALCDLCFLVVYQKNNLGIDDRPKQSSDDKMVKKVK